MPTREISGLQLLFKFVHFRWIFQVWSKKIKNNFHNIKIVRKLAIKKLKYCSPGHFFQISVTTFMGPYTLYFTLVYWVYPIKDYIGETGCHMVMFLRNMGALAIQLQSFFMAIFRYICLFHDNLLMKLDVSPSVSNT